jgi:putative toxin-antitoxin system antitoxin component (TIGR02293 family)
MPSTPADVTRYRRFLRSGMPGPHAYVVLLGLTRFDFPSVVEQINRGLPFSALERFQKSSSLTQAQLLELVQIAPRTLARRKADGRFSPEESDRLVRAARVYGRALEFFDGDTGAATDWLTETQRAFGGDTPLHMAQTDPGAAEVERLLGQLEYGVLP